MSRSEPLTRAGPAYAPPGTQRINRMAIWSLILSILTLGGLGSVAGIMLGVSARRRIAGTGERGAALAAAGVAAPGGGGPAEPAAGSGLLQPPARGLLVPVVMPAYRAGLAQAGPAALVEGHAVLVVGLVLRSAAGREGAGAVQDPGQVP